ncbi:MAG TPA: 3'(2'),5'-bisphosphate nucleotidase CysQ, partial [Candidatus Saccharibacteria bacterium]|nr:3'(2'),5'-bisphosphate nucleotidase CysQ [Candidatus Saccharibacteria bacterium]
MINNINDIIKVVKSADKAILDVYNSSSSIVVDNKEDESPLTEGDTASHRIITDGLRRLFPDIPIISEEGDMQEALELLQSNKFWLVDPLDGTGEFINRTGEFCVAIGLIENSEPVFGIVSAPLLNTVWYGGKRTGSFKKIGDESTLPIHTAKHALGVVVASRSHITPETLEYIDRHFPSATVHRLGSMLKQTAVAEGAADAYPCINIPLKLW